MSETKMTVTQKLSQAFAERELERQTADKGKQAEILLQEQYPLEYVQNFLQSGSKHFKQDEVLSNLMALHNGYKVNAEKTKMDSYITQYQHKQHMDFANGERQFTEAIEALTGKEFRPSIITNVFKGRN